MGISDALVIFKTKQHCKYNENLKAITCTCICKYKYTILPQNNVQQSWPYRSS